MVSGFSAFLRAAYRRHGAHEDGRYSPVGGENKLPAVRFLWKPRCDLYAEGKQKIYDKKENLLNKAFPADEKNRSMGEDRPYIPGAHA